MRRSNLAILLVALVMGGFAAFMAKSWIDRHSHLQAAGPTRTAVVATRQLAFGTVLNSDNTAEITWAGSELPDGAFATKADLLKDGRRIVMSTLDKDELVLKNKITAPGQRPSLSSMLDDGQRAVTIRVDDVRGVAGFVLPGDRVDVVLLRTETRKGETENSADVLVQYVKVLAIDQIASEKQEQPSIATVAKAVTLEVTPDQAQRILLASNIGKLSLVLRQPGQSGSAKIARITDGDLPGAPRHNAPPAPIAVSSEKPAPPPPAPAKAKSDPEDVTIVIFHGTDQKSYQVLHQADVE